MRWLLKNYRITAPLAVVVVAGLAWLAFGYFAVHLLFVDDRVDEAVPVFEVQPAEADVPATDPVAGEPTSPAPTTVQPASTDAVGDPAGTTTVAPSTTAPPPTTQPVPVVVTEYAGSFVSRAHSTSGTAIVLGNGTGERFLRFEGFETENGPDLNVYLVNSAADGVSDYVDLGDLKGNIGDQNYEVPAGVDLEVYDTVLIWCVRFSSPFGEAVLAPA